MKAQRTVPSAGATHNRHGNAMTKYLSEREERRGTRRVFVGGAVVAFLAVVDVPVCVFMPSFHQSGRLTAATGIRTDQPQGVSVTGKTTQPPRLAAHDVVNPPYIGRAPSIESTAKTDLDLKPRRIETIKNYAAQQRRMGTVNFPIAVGAAVPNSVNLHDMPPKLSSALPSYQEDQYFLVPHQFVIVEKKTRRIIAFMSA
jgi:Protein of unknown function (DUF1236)